MSAYYHSNGAGRNNNDWFGWAAIIILFCIPTPYTWVAAAFLLLNKLRGGKKRKGSVKRHPYDIQREAEENWERSVWETPEGAPAAGKASASAEPRGAAPGHGKSAGKKTAGPTGTQVQHASRKQGKPRGGLGLIIAGSIIAGIFGLSSLTVFADAAINDTLRYALTGVIVCAFFAACGLGMLGAGLGRRRRAERYLNYLGYIGTNREVPLAHMAATFDVPVRRLCSDLRKMLSKGILPTGYLDLAEGKLFLTERGYRAPEPKPEPEEEPLRTEEDEDAILREIRQINDDIPGEEMSAKIDRIEEITRRILQYQRQHPDRAGQLRSFLNYYLPTTLKILRAYAQLDAQGIEGENISAAKGRIEGMMDQVVSGFEKQLDKLFQDDALDIATDVEVLENMLKKDGLSDGHGMTLGL